MKLASCIPRWMMSLFIMALLLATPLACSSERGNGSTEAPPPSPTASASTPTEEPTGVSPADVIFEQELADYTFTSMDPAGERRLVDRFERIFGGVEEVAVAVRRVETEDGGFVPVRIAAVSYTLPEGVPFGALASEIGREFLGATPENTSGFAGGKGVYMRDMTNGGVTESVTFFIGKEIFIYAFGASIAAPTEEVSKALLEANE